ncbi:MAG: hypothetical protein SFY67_10370 [Candidatus Melainabacteria bacterium]|nr:hypothetical protein [Candidatus Melainabacteria bacterium]
MKVITPYQFESDYPEDLVPIMIQAYLSLVGLPNKRVFVEPINRIEEGKKGFDAKIKLEGRFSFFYMQFKRPYAYSYKSTSDLVKIRKLRKLRRSPYSLYFTLHRSRGKNTQHKQLRDLLEKNPGHVAYVCPLFLDKETYIAGVRAQADHILQNAFQITVSKFASLSRGSPDTDSIRLQDLELLDHHVKIEPKDDASDNKIHEYSFDVAGKKRWFHGGNPVPNDDSLKEWLLKIKASQGFKLKSSESLNQYTATLKAIKGCTSSLTIPKKPGDMSLKYWSHLGSFLLSKYNIYQYAFCHLDNS